MIDHISQFGKWIPATPTDDELASPLEGLGWEVTPLVASILDKEVTTVDNFLSHPYSENHPTKNKLCKNPICEYIAHLRQTESEDKLNKHPLWFVVGKSHFPYSFRLQDEHIGTIGAWFQTHLSNKRKNRPVSSVPFLHSTAHAYALTLVLLELNRRSWEYDQDSTLQLRRQRKLSPKQLMAKSFQYLIGEKRFESPENKDPMIIPDVVITSDDVLKDAIVDLEKSLFYRSNEVRDSSDPGIWGLDAGSHQNRVELHKLAEQLEVKTDDFVEIEDGRWLDELYMVS